MDITRENFADYFAWQDVNKNFSIWDYVCANVSMSSAIGMGVFFCPTLVDINGALLIRESAKFHNLEEWIEVTKNDADALEKAVNSWEIADFFTLRERGRITHDSFRLLGEHIRYLWNLTLRDRFPKVRMIIELIGQNMDIDPLTIVAYSDKSWPREGVGAQTREGSETPSGE